MPSQLIDHGPHTVVVHPQQPHTDTWGNHTHRPAPTGITITGCTITPIASFDSLSGRRYTGGYKLVCRSAPLGPWARVEWQGRTYTVASVQHHTASPTTTHVVATLSPE